MANKIKFGLKNVHYAIANIAADGTATYETPVAFPGAVSLSMDPDGEMTPFYADNIVYWMSNGGGGYSGDLEIARVIDSFKTDVLGYITDRNGVMVENANAPIVHFALLFQFEGDEKATRHVMYNLTAGRPSASGSTKEETITPQTETVALSGSTIYSNSLGTDIAKADTKGDTDSTTYSNWFNQVYTPVAA